MPEKHFFAESPESVGVDPQKLNELFERAEREVREGLLPSVQIAVAREGKIAGMRTFGNLTHGGRVREATTRRSTRSSPRPRRSRPPPRGS